MNKKRKKEIEHLIKQNSDNENLLMKLERLKYNEYDIIFNPEFESYIKEDER